MEWVEMRVLSNMPAVPAYRLSSRWGQIWGFPGRLSWPQPCPGVSLSAHCPGTLMETSPGAGRCADVAVPRRHLLHILCPYQEPFANSSSSQPSLQSKHLADATWCCCSGPALGTGATVGGQEWENLLCAASSELWSRETGLQTGEVLAASLGPLETPAPLPASAQPLTGHGFQPMFASLLSGMPRKLGTCLGALSVLADVIWHAAVLWGN